MAAPATSAIGTSAERRRESAAPTAASTASPTPPARASGALLNSRTPHAISLTDIHASPMALFSGTKKSPPTNHRPTTTRLKIAKPAIATAGHAASRSERRQSANPANHNAAAVIGHASSGGSHETAKHTPTT